jgi:hypothetical protein
VNTDDKAEILGRELEQVFKGPEAKLSDIPAIRVNWTRGACLVGRTHFRRTDNPGNVAFTLHAEYSRGHKSVVGDGENDPNREGWTRVAKHVIGRFAVDALPRPFCPGHRSEP